MNAESRMIYIMLGVFLLCVIVLVLIPKTPSDEVVADTGPGSSFCERVDKALSRKLIAGEPYSSEDEHFLIVCHPDAASDTDKFIDRLKTNNR